MQMDADDSFADWQFVGDEITAQMPSEKSRLLDIFPGAMQFAEKSDGIFGEVCRSCSSPLDPTNWQMDYYDGLLYCSNCFMEEKCIIPRDVVHNWDFSSKPVSQMSRMVIMDLMTHPNISIMQQNRFLYDAVPILKRVCHLRRQLCYLWFQVISCDAKVMEDLRMRFLDRPYMLSSIQEIHLYSLEDLKMVHNGSMEKMLLTAINSVGMPHVKNCRNCRLQFVKCEICSRSDKPIYLYEIETYVPCMTNNCKSVMHSGCVKKSKQHGTAGLCRICQNLINSGIRPEQAVGNYDQYNTIARSSQNQYSIIGNQ